MQPNKIFILLEKLKDGIRIKKDSLSFTEVKVLDSLAIQKKLILEKGFYKKI